MMPCPKAQALIFERERLDPSAQGALAEHLSTCQACRTLSNDVSHLLAGARQEAQMLARPSPVLDQRIILQTRRALGQTQAPSRRATPWLWALGAGLASAAAAVMLVPQQQAPSMHIATGGPASWVVKSVGEVKWEGGVPSQVDVGSRVVTASSGRVAVQLVGSRVSLSGGSAMTLQKAHRGGTAWSLEKGTAAFDVERMPLESEFVVETPYATVAVLGTVFSLSVDDAGLSVEVLEGVVRVDRSSGSSFVHAPSSMHLQNQAEARGDLQEGDVDAMLLLLSPDVWRDDAAGTLAETKAQIAPPERRETKTHLAKAPQTKAQWDELDRLAEVAQREGCAAAEKAAGAMASSWGTAVRAQGLVVAADCYYASGALAESLGVYQRVVERFGGTPAARNSRFELGRIHNQRGDTASAEQAFLAYAQSYNKDPLAADALFRVCSMRSSDGREREALTCLADLRSRYPNSARVKDSYFLEGEIARVALKDCTRAIGAYKTYISLQGPKSSTAQSHINACQKP